MRLKKKDFQILSDNIKQRIKLGFHSCLDRLVSDFTDDRELIQAKSTYLFNLDELRSIANLERIRPIIGRYKLYISDFPLIVDMMVPNLARQTFWSMSHKDNLFKYKSKRETYRIPIYHGETEIIGLPKYSNLDQLANMALILPDQESKIIERIEPKNDFPSTFMISQYAMIDNDMLHSSKPGTEYSLNSTFNGFIHVTENNPLYRSLSIRTHSKATINLNLFILVENSYCVIDIDNYAYLNNQNMNINISAIVDNGELNIIAENTNSNNNIQISTKLNAIVKNNGKIYSKLNDVVDSSYSGGGYSSTIDQRMKGLILDNGCDVKFDPKLNIRTVNIQSAKHGTSIENINDLQLEYLKCKGFTDADSRKMLMASFLREPLGEIWSNEIDEYFR